MNNKLLQRSPESLQSFQKCKAEIEKLKSQKPSKLRDKAIEQKEKQLEKIQLDELAWLNYKNLKVGDWVCNGSPRPGRINEKYITTYNKPEFSILWEEELTAKSINTGVVTKIDSDSLTYRWIDKQLKRSHDGKLCDDLEVLLFNLNSSKNCLRTESECGVEADKLKAIKQEIDWIKLRWEIVVSDKFRKGDRVLHDDEELIVYGYEKDRATGLQFVWCKSIAERKNPAVDKVINPVELKLDNGIKQVAVNKYTDKPTLETIAISKIRRDGETQQRVELNRETLIEYREAIENGDKFPPVKLKYDGQNYWLYDGFHTTEASLLSGLTEIEAEITSGTQRDAILESFSVNANHGLRRTNADKRKAVTKLLQDEEWSQWSNREIARRCKVSESLVRSAKKDIELTASKNASNLESDNHIVTAFKRTDNRKNYIDKYGNVSQMNTANIGIKETDNKQKVLTDKAENDNNSTDKVISNQRLVENFQIGQLVRLKLSNFEGASEQLRLANHQLGIITGVTENKCSLNVSVFEHKSFVVSPQDLEIVEFVPFCINLTPKQYIALMYVYRSTDGIAKAMTKGAMEN